MSGDWLTVKNVEGWSIDYPETWEAYSMTSPESTSSDSIEQADNVNFSGPKGCYPKKRCGIFQISFFSTESRASKMELNDYIAHDQKGYLSKKEIDLNGMPAVHLVFPEGRNLVVLKYQGKLFHLSFEPNDQKGSDPGLDQIFKKMLSTVKFK